VSSETRESACRAARRPAHNSPSSMPPPQWRDPRRACTGLSSRPDVPSRAGTHAVPNSLEPRIIMPARTDSLRRAVLGRAFKGGLLSWRGVGTARKVLARREGASSQHRVPLGDPTWVRLEWLTLDTGEALGCGSVSSAEVRRPYQGGRPTGS